MQYRLTTRGVGNTSRIEAIRDGKRVVVEVPLLPAPKPGKDDVRNLSGNHPSMARACRNILPSVADELNLDETDGVVIVAVRSGGVASRLDFQPGDIIVQIGQDKITDVVMLDEITRTPQRLWSITIKRGGRTMKLQMSG
ncbi:MAG: PDZ domain-containing protein [Hyphomicrobium sp.]